MVSAEPKILPELVSGRWQPEGLTEGIDTMRIVANDVLRDAGAVADGIVGAALSRLPAQHPAVRSAESENSPPSAVPAATSSPRQARGGLSLNSSHSLLGEVASRSDDGGAL